MLKKRKARGKPALDTVSIFLARSINNFLISSVLLPPPHAATPGGFWVVFAVAPWVLRTVTELLVLAFKSLLLPGVEVAAALEVGMLSCTSPSCWRMRRGRVTGQIRLHMYFKSTQLCVHELKGSEYWHSVL